MSTNTPSTTNTVPIDPRLITSHEHNLILVMFLCDTLQKTKVDRELFIITVVGSAIPIPVAQNEQRNKQKNKNLPYVLLRVWSVEEFVIAEECDRARAPPPSDDLAV